MQIRSRQTRKIKPRVDFTYERFRMLIQAQGRLVRWEQCAPCPCSRVATFGGRTGSTTEHQVDCAGCNGKGVIYHSPQDIRALVTGARSNPERFSLAGEESTSTVSMSLFPEHLPSLYDRFTVKDSSMIMREHRVRTASAVEAMRMPIMVRALDTATALLPYDRIPTYVGVLYCRRADASGNLLAGELVEGTDFEVTAEGALDWTLGDGLGTSPAAGARYALSYNANPRFVAISHPYAWRDTFIAIEKTNKSPVPLSYSLPVNVSCSLEHLTNVS